MLNLIYTKNCDATMEKQLTKTQISLLDAIKSKSRFEQLMEVLPKDWETKFEIHLYNDPVSVERAFMNRTTHKASKMISERSILSVIVSDKHTATPGKYHEYLKRDNDYPIEEDKWKVYMGLTEFLQASFHIDHKLIWTMKEREIDLHSSESLENIPYTYSINVYVPSTQILINVENIKLNGLV